MNVRNGKESGSKTDQIISRPKTLRIGSPVLLVSDQIMDYKWAKTCPTNYNIISLVLTVTVTFWVANGNEYDVAMARLSSTTTAIFALLNCYLFPDTLNTDLSCFKKLSVNKAVEWTSTEKGKKYIYINRHKLSVSLYAVYNIFQQETILKSTSHLPLVSALMHPLQNR